MQSLINMKAGDTCIIKWMMCDKKTAEMMESHNIGPGSRIHVICSCMGNVIIGMDDKRIALGEDATRGIKV